MEFYLFYRKLTYFIAIVSIPNGMEFYGVGHLGFITEIGFNSQRDGILRVDTLDLETLEPFQFPTGWNSTEAQR